jgi:1,4-alpha-glucan branching enzyme
MAVTQRHISASTRMGANLVGPGATFRVWAPRARSVHVVGSLAGVDDWQPTDANRLVRDERGYWAGFVDGARDGDHYKFYVFGEARRSYKRDPYARELSSDPGYPKSNCIVRDPSSYTWQATDWRAPAPEDLVLYQFHIGTFAGPDPQRRVGTLLDAIGRLDHWLAMGINAVQPLPIVEFNSPRSMGYDGSDLFSPEMDYTLEADEIENHLPWINARFRRHGRAPISRELLGVPINQVKVFVDLCHLNGIAVILDVVYNHAGYEIGGQEESLWFFDWALGPDKNQSLYFTDKEHVGPVFAFWKPEVRQFLIDNARFFLDEYRIDGLRFDQVSVIVTENVGSGWQFCQDCTATLRAHRPGSCSIAEHWPAEPNVVRPVRDGGAGFDAAWTDGIRASVRDAIAAASRGRTAQVDVQRIADALWMHGFGAKWRGVQYVESHDEVYRERGQRIAHLADGANARSWYARSRARVASGLVLTAPGIPMLFMGQEFLEDKQWADDPRFHPELLMHWSGLEGGERHMVDHVRFVGDLIRLRRTQPALRAEGLRIIVADDCNRVLAFQRWVEGGGRDVVVVASLNDETLQGYRIGMPWPGVWSELFNSDVYDHFPNPIAAGNGGSVTACAEGSHGLPASADLTIPANSLLVLARPS